MSAFDDLLAFQRQTEALSSIAERLGWDQETVMPRGATEQRAEEMAAIEADDIDLSDTILELEAFPEEAVRTQEAIEVEDIPFVDLSEEE